MSAAVSAPLAALPAMPVLPPGGRLVGLGCDLVEVGRVQRALERHGERFAERVFTPGERAYCAPKANPHPHYAARFAAKEAVSKAFSTGIGEHLRWTSVEVVHGPRGQPLCVLDERGRALLAAVGATDVRLTLAHTAGHALAVAALVAVDPAPAPAVPVPTAPGA